MQENSILTNRSGVKTAPDHSIPGTTFEMNPQNSSENSKQLLSEGPHFAQDTFVRRVSTGRTSKPLNVIG
jgi:hypothetical protein